MLQRIIIIVITCCLVFQLAAQNTEERSDLNRQMTLEREYDPIVQDAAKVNTLPVVQDMLVAKRPVVYADYTVLLFPEKRLRTLPDGTRPIDVLHEVRNGYLHIAAGLRTSFVGDLGYHIVNTDRTKLGLWFAHNSTNPNVSFQQADSTIKRKAVINDNIGGLDLAHRFDKSTLRLGAKFGYSAFNYYGEPTNIITVSSLPLDAKSDFDGKQGNRLLNFYASLASADKYAFGYHLGADITNFNQKYSVNALNSGMSENHFKFDLGLSSAANDGKSFGADLAAHILTRTAPQNNLFSTPDSVFNTQFNGALTPFFLLENQFLHLKLGVSLSLLSFNGDVKALVSPDVSLLLPFANFSAFYAELHGGVDNNSQAVLARTYRYINTAFPATPSKTWIDANAGIRSCPVAGLWFDVFGGYNYTEAELFLNPSLFTYSNENFGNFSLPYQPDAQRFHFGAEAKYEYRHDFELFIKGVYYNYSLKAPNKQSWNYSFGSQLPSTSDKLTTPYGKPSFTFNAGLNARPVKPLTLAIDYAALAGMYAYVNNVNIKMKTVNDMRLRAAWQLNEQLNFYVQFNNLLFQRSELYYGYPLLPFTALLGLNLNF
jgi:hypothetical protein